MMLRIAVQLIAGLCAITLAAPAAFVAKRFGGAMLVAALAILTCPLPITMARFVSKGAVPVWWIVEYGLVLAVLESFTVPAQEAVQNRLIPDSFDGPAAKQMAAKLRNGVNFAGRVAIWCALAFGALDLTGTVAAQATYVFETFLLISFAVVVAVAARALPNAAVVSKITELATVAAPFEPVHDWPVEDNSGKGEEPWQWRHPLVILFLIEFALNAVFLGALMLPRILPDKRLSVMNWILAAGAIGSFLGASVAKTSKEQLWAAIILDLIATSVTFQCHATLTIAAGWVVMSFCYGAFDTLFYRTVLSGMSSRSANLASLRRFLMNGLRPFTMFVMLQLQAFWFLSERQVVQLSTGISAILIAGCWLKRSEINKAISNVQST
jgi:hypothetical protein